MFILPHVNWTSSDFKYPAWFRKLQRSWRGSRINKKKIKNKKIKKNEKYTIPRKHHKKNLARNRNYNWYRKAINQIRMQGEQNQIFFRTFKQSTMHFNHPLEGIWYTWKRRSNHICSLSAVFSERAAIRGRQVEGDTPSWSPPGNSLVGVRRLKTGKKSSRKMGKGPDRSKCGD